MLERLKSLFRNRAIPERRVNLKNQKSDKRYLFVNESQASNDARAKFEEIGMRMKIISASGPTVPCVKIGNASFFGRWGLDFIAGHLRDMK